MKIFVQMFRNDSKTWKRFQTHLLNKMMKMIPIVLETLLFGIVSKMRLLCFKVCCNDFTHIWKGIHKHVPKALENTLWEQ